VSEFTITEEEHADLIEAYRHMQNTPVIMVGKNHDIDLAEEAAKAVRDKMERLGQKYGYDFETAKIMPNSTTFEAEPLTPPPKAEEE